MVSGGVKRTSFSRTVMSAELIMGGLVVGTLHWQLAVAGSTLSHDTAWLFLKYVTIFDE